MGAEDERLHVEVVGGATVLDVGCGTGDDARELARLVGPEGRRAEARPT
jgi:ubiquinone/menaquinone biosynthesis C-methylase UbiE